MAFVTKKDWSVCVESNMCNLENVLRQRCPSSDHVWSLLSFFFSQSMAHLFSTPGNVFGAEIARFGRAPAHVRLPSQTTAVAADFVECWAVPKSSLKGVADALILWAAEHVHDRKYQLNFYFRILDHLLSHQLTIWPAQMEETCDWLDYKKKLALGIVQDHRILSDAGRNGGFRYLELASRLIHLAPRSGLYVAFWF